jgi:hypothetical protein
MRPQIGLNWFQAQFEDPEEAQARHNIFASRVDYELRQAERGEQSPD